MNCKTKFLATTALTNFWDITQPIVFLGDWCVKSEEELKKAGVHGEFLSADSTDSSCSKEAFYYTNKVYESLLPKISEWLNNIHQETYSLQYWRMIVGPFLLWYIQVVHHRFVHLKAAFQLYPNIKTFGLASHSFLTPIDTSEFYFFASESDAWNLQLITQILECTSMTSLRYFPHYWEAELACREKKLSNIVKYKNSTQLKLNILKYFLKIWPFRKVGLACCMHEFSKRNILKLIIRSGFRIFPVVEMQTMRFEQERKYNVDSQLRQSLKNLLIGDGFIDLILKTLVVNMPLNFVEHYKQEIDRSKKHFPYKIDAVISTTWMQHDLLKMWGAYQKSEFSTKLVNIQHGGGYGMVNYCTYEILERKNCDVFISWGWTETKEILPASSILACERFFDNKKNRLLEKNPSRALWIANEIVRYTPYISSYYQSPRSHYLEWQSRFFHSLSKYTASQVTMRLMPASKKVEIVKKYMPNLNIYAPKEKGSFFNQLRGVKILLCDTLNTTFLYAFVFNVPVLIFASQKFWTVRQEVSADFNELKRLHIYHDTPESAANWLNENYDNIDKIWHTKEIQLIRKNFVDRFARVNVNWVIEWKNILLNL